MACFIALFRNTYHTYHLSAKDDLQNFCKRSNCDIFYLLLDRLVVNDIQYINDI